MPVLSSMRLVTAEELLHMPEDGFKHELVEGSVIRMPPPGVMHGFCGTNIFGPLYAWAKKNGRGLVFGEVGFKLASDPDTVRAPDVAFIARSRLREPLPRGYWDGPPDLAVEVLAPDDRPKKVQRKLQDWLTHGTRLVWVVDPKARTLTVHRPDGEPTVLGEQEMLESEDVLPGFRMAVRDVFADA